MTLGSMSLGCIAKLLPGGKIARKKKPVNDAVMQNAGRSLIEGLKPPPPVPTDIYIGNIHRCVTDGELYYSFLNVLSEIIDNTDILSCEIKKKNGVGKGFGFMTIASYDIAVIICEHMNGYVLREKKLKVQISNKSKAHLKVVPMSDTSGGKYEAYISIYFPHHMLCNCLILIKSESLLPPF